MSQKSKSLGGGVPALGLFACLAAVGCSEIHPAPDQEEAGMLESPTDEADHLRETEGRQEGERRR